MPLSLFRDLHVGCEAFARRFDKVRERLATRGTEIDWDEFVYLDQQRRDALARIENSRSGKTGFPAKSAR